MIFQDMVIILMFMKLRGLPVHEMYVLVATMKLYSLTVMYKGLDGKVKKLCGSSDLASFGYFQRSRLATQSCISL